MRLIFAVALMAGPAGSAAAFVPMPLASRAPLAHSRLAADTGAFLFDENGKKGKLVVSFEPVDDGSTPPPPSPAPDNRKRSVFPDVNLPENEVPEPIGLSSVNTKVIAFLLPALQTMSAKIGQPKSPTIFESSQVQLIQSQNIGHKIPESSEYKFFGNGEHAANLICLLKTNPFMATALTEKRDGFELRSFDKHPVGKSSTLYRKIISTLNGSGYRVNIQFNSEMSQVKRMRVYDDTTGAKIKDLRPENGDEKEIDYWASAATYGLIFYASSIHATIHLLHYLMTAALDYCSTGFDAMNQWAKFYATNVPTKYGQVASTLIRDQPSSFTGIFPQFSTAESFEIGFGETYAALTGSAGFGADGVKLIPILEELIEAWGASPCNFLENMMHLSSEKMVEGGIMTEFKKHHDLVKPFASDATKALSSIDNDKHTIAELRLKDYLKRCNFKSNINTLEEWIDLMSTTGIVHGSTLSYSRMGASADIMRWRNIHSDVLEMADIKLHTTLLGTICGMDEHRHVFTPATDTGGETYATELEEVLLKYDTASSELKEAYKIKIMEDREKFNNLGWILSDFCPSGFDGKQLTVTTYI